MLNAEENDSDATAVMNAKSTARDHSGKERKRSEERAKLPLAIRGKLLL
jgi:hypothetical protein